MSNDRTGFARGSLTPVVYFEDKDGKILMPPIQIGSDVNHARKAYDLKYAALGYEWREARTLAEVDQLQRRLQEATQREAETKLAMTDQVRDMIRKETASNLRQRMISSNTPDFERRFITAYLNLQEDKRSKHLENFKHREAFLWAREYDSGSKIEDKIVGYDQAGE